MNAAELVLHVFACWVLGHVVSAAWHTLRRRPAHTPHLYPQALVDVNTREVSYELWSWYGPLQRPVARTGQRADPAWARAVPDSGTRPGWRLS